MERVAPKYTQQKIYPPILEHKWSAGGLRHCSTVLLLRHSCATEIVVVSVGCATTYYVGGAGGGGANGLAPAMRH